MNMTIKRVHQDDCTVGVLNYGDYRCLTLELPYLFNHQNVSCIPPGEYSCIKVVSGKFGECVSIENVTGRKYIRIHYGNYTRDIEGCVLVGDSIKDIDKDGILDVTNSRNTFNKLMNILPDKFTLSIM